MFAFCWSIYLSTCVFSSCSMFVHHKGSCFLLCATVEGSAVPMGGVEAEVQIYFLHCLLLMSRPCTGSRQDSYYSLNMNGQTKDRTEMYLWCAESSPSGRGKALTLRVCCLLGVVRVTRPPESTCTVSDRDELASSFTLLQRHKTCTAPFIQRRESFWKLH